MSLVLTCDRCGKPIDLRQGYYDVRVRLMAPPSPGTGAVAPMPAESAPPHKQVCLDCVQGAADLL